MRYSSPLRYPGGKASLAPFLHDVLQLNSLVGCRYFEPYAGGAGAALALLRMGAVASIEINDADRRIYSFWKSVLSESQRFADRIMTVPLNLEEWKRQREVCTNQEAHTEFDVGFAAFYMNRCNRSGVLTSGPIGGLEQSGAWKLDVRFTRPSLVERVVALGRLKDRISVSQMDAIDFLKARLPSGTARKTAFVYLDPPYVVKGQRLYLNAYEACDHKKVANYLGRQGVLNWIMSYDDSDLIRDLYSERQLAKLPIRYSLQDKRAAKELIIAPRQMQLPKTVRVAGQDAKMSEMRIGAMA